MKMKFKALLFGLFAFVSVQAQTVQDGVALLNAEKYTEAEALFKKLAETPSADNQYYLGYYLVKMNRLDEAQKAFEKGLEIDDKSVINQVGLGTVALGKGDKAKAKEYFDAAEKKKKKDADILYRIGEAYTLFEKNNDPAEAIRLLDEAVKRNKDLADAYIAKGDALMIRNEGGPAATAYEYALTAKPNYALAHQKMGQIYLRSKNYQLAGDYYKKAIEADPNFSPAYKDLAELYFLARQYKKAAENYDLYIQKSGNTDPLVRLRGTKFAFTADDYPKVLSMLDEIKGKINDPMMKRMYGWSYAKTNEPDKAIQNLTELISELEKTPERLNPDDFKYLGRAYNAKAAAGGLTYDSLGMVYMLKGADIDTSASERAATYKEVATLYYGAKDYAKAASTFKTGIAADTAKASPNDYYYYGLSNFQQGGAIVPSGADSIAILQKKRGFYLAADSIFAIVTQKTPDWPIGYYWRGSSLYNAYDRQENVDKGISAPYYLKLTELAEKDADPSKYKGFLKLAYRYLAFYTETTLKDKEKAKGYWEKLLAIDPEDPAAKEALGLTPAPAEAAAATPAAKPKVAPKKK